MSADTTGDDTQLAADRTRARRRGDAYRVTLADLRSHAGIQLHRDDWDNIVHWLNEGNAIEIAGCDANHELVKYLFERGHCQRIAQTRQLTLADAAAIRNDKHGSILICGTGGEEYDSARVTLFARRNSISRTDAADWLATIAGRRITVPALAAFGTLPIANWGTTGYSQFSTRANASLVGLGH